MEMNNAALKVNGIYFETLMPESEFSVPIVNEKQKFLYNLKFFFKRPLRSPLPFTKVQVGMKITNNILETLRFSLYRTLIPEILGADGQIIRRVYSSLGFSMPRESDFPLVRSGESITFFPEAKVFWSRGDLFTLSIATGNGGYWNFSDLKLGCYQFRFSYQKQDFWSKQRTSEWEPIEKKFLERVWTGQADTLWVNFCLVKS